MERRGGSDAEMLDVALVAQYRRISVEFREIGQIPMREGFLWVPAHACES